MAAHSLFVVTGTVRNSTVVARRSTGVGPWADPVSFVYGRFTAFHRNEELPPTSLRRWCTDIRFLSSWWHGRAAKTYGLHQWRGVVDAIQSITAERLEHWSALVLVGSLPASDSNRSDHGWLDHWDAIISKQFHVTAVYIGYPQATCMFISSTEYGILYRYN